MAYTVKDISGKTYALEAEINLTEEENGMVIIETEIEPTENNQKFIKELNEHWTISGIKPVQYGDFHIQHLEKTGIGEWPTLKIEAVADFIYRLQTTTFDGYFTGSRTAVSFFNELSQQSGITIQPVDFKPAFGWEKFGLGVHNISEFNRGLNNYGYTYYPVTPQIIELHDEIGRDVQFMIKNAMNSDSMKMEIDRTEVYTYVEGYADYEEGEGNDNFYKSANLYDYYKHPVLYDLLGELKAETYTNQKINNKDTLHRYLKNIVDNSIKFTITTDFRQIDDYPYAVPMLGDRIRVQDEAIDIDTTARAVKIKTFYDTYGDVIDYEIDFGNFSVSDRVKSTLDEVQSQVEDLISGRNPVGMGMLDGYVSAVIDSIKKSETQIKFGEHLGLNGQFLVDPNDPNNAVGLFSSGIVATENGFAGGINDNLTITPKGIHADMIRVGTLWLENFLGIIGRNNLMEMTADYLRAENADDSSKFTEFSPEGLTTSGTLKALRDDGGHPSIIAGRNTVGERLQGMNPAFMQAGPIRIFGQRYATESSELVTVDAYYFNQFFRDIQIKYAFRNNNETESYIVEYGAVGFGGETFTHIETIEVPPKDTVYPSLDFHISVPQGEEKQFYLKFASKTPGKEALMSIASVKNLDMSKYDHL